MAELLESVSVYTDGGSRGNPGPSAIGVLVYSQSGHLLADFREQIGESTNNRAEYSAVLKGLQIASRFTNGDVSCHSDSSLMVNQLSGSFRTKNPGLRDMVRKVREAEKAFRKVVYRHDPRTSPRIKLADTLVNRALDESGE
jgi:ribonuclease HI